MFAKIVLLILATSLTNGQHDKVNNVAFIKLGSHKISDVETKSYYIPRYFKSFWTHTRSVCRAYGMDVVSLETKAEEQNFLHLCHNNAALFEQWTHIGGITLVGKSTNDWYWVNSDKRIDYELKFLPGQPDNMNNREHCLSIGKSAGNIFMFNDIECFAVFEFKFICQLMEEHPQIMSQYVSDSWSPQPLLFVTEIPLNSLGRANDATAPYPFAT